jgi:heme exporter protein D
MNWNSPAEFFAMGGYAFYIWGSFVVTAAAFAVEVVALRKRRSEAIANLRGTRAARRTPAQDAT